MSFTRQQEPLGLGHAVWCARELVGDEPFAVLLPDMICEPPGCLGADGRGLRPRPAATSSRSRNAIRGETEPYGIVGVGEAVETDAFRITGDGGEAEAGRGALQPLHQRPLHPAAGDLRAPRQAGARRRQRDPAHRRHAPARRDAALLRLPLRRPHLRLRHQARLPRRQRRASRWSGPISPARLPTRFANCSRKPVSGLSRRVPAAPGSQFSRSAENC